MASQSQPPSTAEHTLAPRPPGPRLGLSRRSRSCPPSNPFTINHFRTRMSHASPVTREKSAAYAHFLSPRGCAPTASKNASSVFASPVSTLDFSVTCSRLQSLCALFRALALYFQRLTASFPGVVPYCRLLESTLSHCSVLSAPGVLHARCAAANEMRGNLKVGGDTGTVTSRTFVAAAGLVLGFALQDAARAAQVLACSRPLVRDPHRVQPGEVNSLLRRPRDAEKAGFSRSQGHIAECSERVETAAQKERPNP